MVGGVFEVGETVEGFLDFGQIDSETGGNISSIIQRRCCR